MIRKQVLRLCLAIIALGLYAVPARAGIYQAPHTGTSFSFSAEYKGGSWMMDTLDDFIFPTEQIIGLRWWGSYWTAPETNTFTNYSDGMQDAAPGGIGMFTVWMAENWPPTPTMPFEHPVASGGQVWHLPIASVTVTEAFTVTTMNGIQRKVYEYRANLGPMDQSRPLIPGTKYWLGIRADFQVGDRQWGWHEADAHYGSYAVQSVIGDYYRYQIPCGGHDMAFELVTVPEPSAFAAVAVGLAGLAGSLGRARRRSGR